MKRIVLIQWALLALILFPVLTMAQTPQSFKYQAVVRDAGGQVLADQAVSFRIRILQGSISGSSVYSETHTDTTNGFGLSNLEIGNGVADSGAFDAIDWGEDHYFVQVLLDATGGSNYQLMGTSQLLSVPYALHAQTADTVLNNADADPANELQQLSVTGDTIFISAGNFIVLPGLSKLPTLLSIQGRLDNGETPLEIFNSGEPLDSLYGKTYQGGLIFYLDTQDTIPGIEGMVAAPVDQDVNGDFFRPWGCSGTDLPSVPNVTSGPSGPGAEIGDGASNTMGIIMDCSDTTNAASLAANYTGGGFTDWFLPSILELDEIFNHIGPGAPAPNTNVGGFASDFYWSSTEFGYFFGVNFAWGQVFVNGNLGSLDKVTIHRVRAVRAF